MQVRLTDIIGPAYYAVHQDIRYGRHTYYDLYGGRGSLKSSFASVELVLGLLKDPEANGIVFRKVANTLRLSVYEQVGWAIDALNMSDKWSASVSPMQYTYKPTGQVIVFRGLDKAKKLKSIKCKHGYFKFLWFEELDEFAGPEEIRSVQQSVLRGGDDFVVFKTFNPPISASNWANMYVAEPDKRALRLKTDYTSAPAEWLGTEFLEDVEHLKATNERAYKHEYLGMAIGLGTSIFDMLEIRTITDDEIKAMDRIHQGQDWGWYPDPKAFLRIHYSHKDEKIYAVDEMGGCKIRNSIMAQMIKDKGYDDFAIICGADEQQSIVDYRDAGLPARSTNACPGSVRYEMEWMQCRTIVIDPVRTPQFYDEVIHYEHELDTKGQIIADYPDHDNHYIDACRYAISQMALRRGESA